jgi:uncharacterized protein (TIGR02678 family)
MSIDGLADSERAAAIRALLARPLRLRRHDPELFRSIAVHRTFLVPWFEDHLGWRLHVDVRAGTARLHKRTTNPDARRGLVRRRTTEQPFDPRRYQLFALACAELLARPHATLGELADAVQLAARTDPDLLDVDMTRQAHRFAFVDVVTWLHEVGAIEVTAGDIGQFADAKPTDAVLRADTSLIPLLLSSDVPPSRVQASSGEQWLEVLAAEPRYGTAATDPEHTDRDQRNRWARHQALRRLLDDAAVDLDELPPTVRGYLDTPAGRDKALAAATSAGFIVERHADVWLAIDETGGSTLASLGSTATMSTVEQATMIVLARLVTPDKNGERRPVRRSREALRGELDARLRSNRRWARKYQVADGAALLLGDALARLEELALVRIDGDFVLPRPAASRFAVRLAEEVTDA